MKINEKSLLLASGGLDSTVLAYKLKNDNVDFSAMVLQTDEGTGIIEEQSALYFMEKLGVELEVLDISPSIQNLINQKSVDEIETSAVVSIPPITIPPITTFRIGERPPGQHMSHSFAGNYCGTLFGLANAITFALQRNIHTIYYGIHADDKNEFAENNREYFDALANLVRIETGKDFNILTPLIDLSKAEVIKLGLELGVEVEKTRSCGSTKEIQCGLCDACERRKIAFEEGGVVDETLYVNDLYYPTSIFQAEMKI